MVAEDEQVTLLRHLEDQPECSPRQPGSTGPSVRNLQREEHAHRAGPLRRVALGLGLTLAGTALAALAFRWRSPSSGAPLDDGVIALAEAHSKACHTAVAGEKCFGNVMWARTQGIYAHPEWYPHLTADSTFEQFQAHLHDKADGACAMPCAPAKSTTAPATAAPPTRAHPRTASPAIASTTAAPTTPAATTTTHKPVPYHPSVNCSPPMVPIANAFDDCGTAAEGSKCWDRVQWAMTDGMSSHPEWYAPLTASSSFAEFQNMVHRDFPEDCPKPCQGGGHGKAGARCGCPPPQVEVVAGQCQDPHGPSEMSFYVYRAQGDDDYVPENVNVADLPGVMWYLHNEVVASTPRKFGVTRVLRYRLTMMNTAAFVDTFHKQFGPFVAFDSGACTAPNCNDIWNKYGFVVGCQNLDRNVANYVRYDPTDGMPKEDLTVIRKLSAHNSSHGNHSGHHGGHENRSSVGEVRVNHSKAHHSGAHGGLRKHSERAGGGGHGERAKAHDGKASEHGGHGNMMDRAASDLDRHAHSEDGGDKTTSVTTTTLDDKNATSTTTAPATTTATSTTFTTHFESVNDGRKPGIWFSLPGACPEADIKSKTKACVARMPGGFCQAVTGASDCTYKYEPAGEISLDELSGILDPAAGIHTYMDFWATSYSTCMAAKAQGKVTGECKRRMEFDVLTDRGVGTHFWDGKHDAEKCSQRMDRVREMFREKYPELPDDHELPVPDCL